LRSRSFVTSASSSWRSGAIIAIAETHSFLNLLNASDRPE
jgi:hypothetical protein